MWAAAAAMEINMYFNFHSAHLPLYKSLFALLNWIGLITYCK